MTSRGQKRKRLAIALAAAFIALAAFIPAFLLAVNSTDWIDISTEEELLKVHDDLGGNYRLTGDIYLKEPWTPIGTEDKPFRGLFNGNQHSIYNAKITDESALQSRDDEYLVGLFGVNEGTIIFLQSVDIHFDLTNKENNAYCFGNIAAINKGYVTTCRWWWRSGKLTIGGEHGAFGGFVGRNYGQIKKCYSEANLYVENLNGDSSVGLLAGEAYEGSLIDWCKAYPQIVASPNTSRTISVSIGSIVGRSHGGIINNCDCRSTITVSQSFGTMTSIGGAIGSVAEGGETIFQQSVRSATITYNGEAKDVYIGGIFGRMESANCKITIENAAFMGRYSISEADYASSCGCGETGIETRNFLYAHSPNATVVYHYGTRLDNYDEITISALHLDESIWEQSGSVIKLR